MYICTYIHVYGCIDIYIYIHIALCRIKCRTHQAFSLIPVHLKHVCMYIYTHTYTYTYVFIHIYTHCSWPHQVPRTPATFLDPCMCKVYVCVCMYIYIYIYIYIYVYIYLSVCCNKCCTHQPLSVIPAHVKYVCMYIYTHKCMYVCMYLYRYIYIYMLIFATSSEAHTTHTP